MNVSADTTQAVEAVRQLVRGVHDLAGAEPADADRERLRGALLGARP